MVDKYKSTKCIDHLFGRARRRKKRATTGRFIQHELKFDRRKLTSTIEVEIKNERGILLHVDIVRKRAHGLGRIARKKSYVDKINREKRFKSAEEMFEKPVKFWKNVAWFDE